MCKLQDSLTPFTGRVIPDVSCAPDCGLVGEFSKYNHDNNPEVRANHWWWLAPNPRRAEMILTIETKAGEAVYVDSVHVATECISTLEPTETDSDWCWMKKRCIKLAHSQK